MEHSESPANRRVAAMDVRSVAGVRWLVIDVSDGPTGVFYKEVFGLSHSGAWELVDSFVVEDGNQALLWSRKLEGAQCFSVPVPDLGPTHAPANIANFAQPRRVAAKGSSRAQHGRKMLRLRLPS